MDLLLYTETLPQILSVKNANPYQQNEIATATKED